MANNFKPWVDSPIAGQEVQSASVFASDIQRIEGFKAGDPASALRINSALRQANLVICALMQMCDDIQTLPEDLTLLSTTTAVKNAIKAAIDKLDQAILTSSKQYTDSAASEIDTEIRNLQNQITTNKNNIDANSTAIEQRVTIDAFNTALAQKQDKGDYATNSAVETLLKQYFKIPEIEWVTGTSGNLKIPSSGWYIFKVIDDDDTIHLTGLTYVDKDAVAQEISLGNYNDSIAIRVNVMKGSGIISVIGNIIDKSVSYIKVA